MNSFSKSQFSYYPLVWIFYSCTIDNKVFIVYLKLTKGAIKLFTIKIAILEQKHANSCQLSKLKVHAD